MTPAEILQKCMRECGSDPDAGLTAFEYIMSNGLDMALSTDEEGHEHKEKGPGGGQFTGKGGTGSSEKGKLEEGEHTFFHGTVSMVKDSILDKGLIPGASKGATVSAGLQRMEVGGRESSVYFSSTLSEAYEYADFLEGHYNAKADEEGDLNSVIEGVFFRVTFPPEEANKILPDEKGREKSFRYEGSIPKEWISYVGTLREIKKHLKATGKLPSTGFFGSSGDQRRVHFVVFCKGSRNTPLSILLAFDIHSRHAQGVLNRTIKAGKDLSKKARTDLAAALERAATDNGTAIIEFIEEYRLQLAQLLTTTQLSALLEGAREVMGKIPEVSLPGGRAGNANPGGPGLPQDRTGADARDTGGIHYPAIHEAARGLAGRGVLSPDEYETLEVKAKAKAFTVAGVDAEQTLSKIRDTLAENVREGEGHEAFRKRVLESVDEGTFLNDAHLETVFRTNVQTAYSDGQEVVLQHPLIRSGFPYRAYDAIHDDRVRDNHLALEKLGIDGGNIYRADDPVWQMFRPPWDYNDRCSATPVTVRQAAEAGVKEAKEWLDTGVEPYPPTFVDMPGFRPPEGFQRVMEGLPLSIRLSMQPMATFAHDVSGEARDESGKWTSRGDRAKRESNIPFTDKKVSWESHEYNEWGINEDDEPTLFFKTSSNREFAIFVMDKKEWANIWGDTKEVVFIDKDDSIEVTGRGEALQVFSNVTAATVSYLNNTKPESIMFSAMEEGEKEIPRSRATLYNRIAKQIASSVPGYFAAYGDKYDGAFAATVRYYIIAKNELKEELLQKAKDSIKQSDPRYPVGESPILLSLSAALAIEDEDHDVSDEARDEGGKWTKGGSKSGEHSATSKKKGAEAYEHILKKHFDVDIQSYHLEGVPVTHVIGGTPETKDKFAELKEGDRYIQIGYDPDENTIKLDFAYEGKDIAYQNETLQKGSLDLMHKILDIMKDVHDSGMKLLVEPSDGKRARFYEKLLKRAGLEKIEGKDISSIWMSLAQEDGLAEDGLVEEETDAALLYGQVDDTSAASSNAPDAASTDTSRDKDKDKDKKKRGKKNKRKRGIPRALRVKQEWLNALDGALSLDVSLGQWITVGGEEEPGTGEKHHGGFHVFVDGSGRILKGRMKGKNVRSLKSSFDRINKVKGGKSGGRQRPNEPGKPDQSGGGAGGSRAGSGRAGGGAVPQRAGADSGALESPPPGSGSGVPGEGGQVKGKPPGAITPEPGPGTEGAGAKAAEGATPAARPSAAAISAGPADVYRAVAEVTDKLDKVNARMERYGEFFRAKGQEQVADWLGMLQEQVNEVGIDRALDMLGEERIDDSDPSKVAYRGSGYFEEGKETDFIRAYLDRAGIALQIAGSEPMPGMPIIAPAPIPKEELEKYGEQYKDAVIATDTPLDDKLQESKLLPGLESTEDVSKLMGREVTALTPDVIGKLDQTYGKGKWIIKSYGDESYAGFGIFFPQRAAQIQQSAKEAMWEAKEKLAGYGYSLVRERKTGLAAGVRDANTGKLYRFNSEDIGSIPDKNVQKIAKWASFSAPDEKGARLPTSSEESLKQKYGVSLRKDESGKFVGITDWYGRDLNFDSPRYAKFKENAEAVAYEVERVKAWEGVAGKVSFMAQPAFEAIGVTEEERALGVTWETSREGRVHVTVRDGKASVVPFATMARREDTMPAVFADDDIRAMERAAQEAIDGLPPGLRTGQVYAPDVMKTKDGWRVVELNASVETGSSAWLESNPLVMDAVVSHFTGREPQHVKFMRNLLRDKAKSSRPGVAGKGPAPIPPVPGGSKPGAAPAPAPTADPDEVNIGEPAESPQAAAPQQPSPQGTQQAAKPSPHTSSVPEHARKAFGAIDKHLQMSGVDDAKKDEYGKAAAHVMKSMSPTAAERFEKHVNNARFVNSSEEVRESLAKEFELSHPEFAKQIRGLTAIGGAFGNTSEGGALILDGGYTEAEQKLIEPGGFMEGAKQAADIYAHEFSHAIDGPEHEISTSDDWLLAWHRELGEESDLKLTDYAEQNPEEGFAEFGRLMLSGKYPPETIKNIYPTCYAVWEKHGLTSGGADQSMSFGGAGGNVTLDELFGERVEYPDKNGHADVLLQGNKGGAAMAFDPEQPRKPKGSKEGGQFAPKGRPGGVRTIKHGSLKVKFSKHTDKRIKGSRLKLINYKQQDVHSCGFVAALTLAHYLKTGKSPRDVLKAVRPSVNSGVDRHNLIGSLKKLGIEADYKTDLTIAALRKYVEEGTPVIVSVWPDQWISDHWTIVQGFEGDKIHLTNHKSLPLKLFKKQWSDMDMRGKGDSAEGIVCRRMPPGAEPEEGKALATDARGHKHKGKGEGGGQFTSTGGGSTTGVKAVRKKASKKESEVETGSAEKISEEEKAKLYASAEEFKATRDKAQKKIKEAPIPSAEAVEKAKKELELYKEGTGTRPGGESRGGGAEDRRRQRVNLFNEFGGEERGYVLCHGCGRKLHHSPPEGSDLERLERGKIFVKNQGGGYQLPNLLPECFACNRSRNDEELR